MTAMIKVEAALRARGESLSAFAARIGVRSQDLNNWKKRGLPRTRQRLVADALGWTLDHLLVDDAACSITSPPATECAPGPAIAEPVSGCQVATADPDARGRSLASGDVPTDRSVLIPRRRLVFSASSGELVFEPQTPPLAFDADWLSRIGLSVDNAAVIDAQGDSMAPLIHEGDVLLVNLGDRAVRDGQIFALRYARELRVRRLYRRYDGCLILRSENRERYPDETVPRADQGIHVQVVGCVLWRGGQI
ncbi:S24 family peptidase [uncultured Thiodictyon sp.]|uniref:S24 family peptidase n=1 Tax=uncultured Thiodictyon sp. TaxID=1846217 RepID=UPI0025E77138|nr:S24 family peptidase [uncultured Thiodictyon sp.]